MKSDQTDEASKTAIADGPDASGRAMLGAAWELLLASLSEPIEGRGRIGLFEQVMADDVAKRAGLSTGAFYNRWKKREHFIQDMIDFSLSEERMSQYAVTVKLLDRLIDEGASIRKLVEEGTAINLEQVENDLTFAAQVNLWSLCRARPELGPRLKKLYENVLGRWEKVYIAVAQAYGLTFRPPFDAAILGKILAALVEGLAMQRVVDEDVPKEVFGWAALAMFPFVFRLPEDERSLFDIWAHAERKGESTLGLAEKGGPFDVEEHFQLPSLLEQRAATASQLQKNLEELMTLEGRIGRLLKRGNDIDRPRAGN